MRVDLRECAIISQRNTEDLVPCLGILIEECIQARIGLFLDSHLQLKHLYHYPKLVIQFGSLICHQDGDFKVCSL